MFYPLTNHLGQTFMTIRGDGKLGHEQYTDPFGKVQAMYIDKSLGIDNTGPLPLTDGLPGQYLQPSAYLDNGHRTYQDGRYLQPDRLDVLGRTNDPELWMAEEMGAIQLPQYMAFNHMYGYANQNPVMNIDIAGLCTLSTMCPRVPKFPEELLPKKKAIEQCLKGKSPRESLDDDTLKAAADYYESVANSVNTEQVGGQAAQNLNRARAQYLRGKTNTPPGNTQTGNY